MKTKQLKQSDLDLDVSFFCGPLLVKETKTPKMCDVCGIERANWVHVLKHRHNEKAYVCFGCGEH